MYYNITWRHLTVCLELHEGENRHGFWTDGDDILCPTKEAAESVANFLEDIGFDQLMTGYYDPDEDSRNGETDGHTGYWYIRVD